jgi:hypothetical protein
VATIIAKTDLPTALQSAEMVDLMVAGANARAARVAPCLIDTTTPPTSDQLDEAKLILVGAVKRWAEAGAGALQSQTAGPYGMTVDTRQRTGFNLWPSEITDLQNICKAIGSASAYSIDTVGTSLGAHAPYCDLFFGGTACSCGANLTGGLYPLYE